MDFKVKEFRNHYLEPNHFLGLSNNQLSFIEQRIPDENLEKLALFAETIEPPYIIGQFNSEHHYLRTLELSLNSTLETENRILFFLNQIVPTISTNNSVLDIGPGDGALTRVLANHFKQITVIDSNQHILNNLKLLSSVNIKKINKSILDVVLESNTYNLAVLSHILYYIAPKYWFDVVKSIYKSLDKDGVLVIVLGGDELGKADLIKYFGGQLLAIDDLAGKCLDMFGVKNTHLYASKEAFAASSQKAMFHISAFMLGDANVSANQNDLVRYIEENFQQSEKYFEMTTRQKYIVIRKE